MPGGFRNKPRILRGAFVEYGLSIPPLVVVFQFNPVQLSRSRSLFFPVPYEPELEPVEGETEGSRQPWVAARSSSLREYHHREEFSDLLELQRRQIVNVQEESIRFEIRLDATDKLNEGDVITTLYGIAPQLATLEAMVYPKSESLLGELLPNLTANGFSFTQSEKPPMILFIWGKRVLPVNINSINITETEFSIDLNPTRATVEVNLTVIEGPNQPYTCSRIMREAMSALNLANVADIANVVIPG